MAGKLVQQNYAVSSVSGSCTVATLRPVRRCAWPPGPPAAPVWRKPPLVDDSGLTLVTIEASFDRSDHPVATSSGSPTEVMPPGACSANGRCR
jgi:hypothetical protein